MASEIQHALRSEGAHMDVVVRRRGDGKKAVPWQVSELRTIEIFEALCASMEDYFLMSHLGRRSWVKLNGREGDALVAGSVDIGSMQSREERRELRMYCETLLEAHEDALSAAIRTAQAADLAQFLCVDEVAVCAPADLIAKGAAATGPVGAPPADARSHALAAALGDFVRLLAPEVSTASQRAASLAAVKVALRRRELARFVERDGAYLVAMLRKMRDVASIAPLTTEQLHLDEVKQGGFGRIVEVGREERLARRQRLLSWLATLHRDADAELVHVGL